MIFSLQRTLALVLFAAAASSSVRAQCPTWDPGFHLPGVFDDVRAMTVFDDGHGQKLYVGGKLHLVGTLAVSGLARLNGTVWEPVGDLLSGANAGEVDALTVFNDGTGPALYIGGKFDKAGGVFANNIVRFNGTAWTPLHSGTIGVVSALKVFDDGGGPALFVGGSILSVDGIAVNGVARWRANAWSGLGAGVYHGSGGAGYVAALEVFGSGAGAELYAGGGFEYAGTTVADGIARWNGSAWSSVGNGVLPQSVLALKTFDDGSGPALYATGHFFSAGGQSAARIARWNGTTWSSLGSGLFALNDTAFGDALEVFDDGTGPALYVGGFFQTAGGVAAANIARWNGAGFTALGSGINAQVKCLRSFDDGSGRKLFAGGSFSSPTDHGFLIGLGRWNGSAWLAVGDGNGLSRAGSGSSTSAHVMEVYDSGAGPELYVGGDFTGVGSLSAAGIARWTSAGWSPVGSGLGGNTLHPDVFVSALKSFDSGSGPELFVSGSFYTAGGNGVVGFARWNGSAWIADRNAPYSVGALEIFDDGSGPQLYAGGDFYYAPLTRFDGASWTPVLLGVGFSGWGISSLASFDDGSGPALFAAGFFYSIGGTSVHHIARWNGTSWSSPGTGFGTNPAFGLAVHDDGSGRALYACGAFTDADGAPVDHIARWNGASWSAVGSQPFGAATVEVVSLASVDLGSGVGPMLVACGTCAGPSPGTERPGVAAWNGSTWLQLDGGLGLAMPIGNQVGASAARLFNDGSSSGPALFVGGRFTTAGETSSVSFARLRLCGTPGSSFCAGDGSGTACPCANSGVAGHGCNNSASTGGALLATSGGALLAQDDLGLHSSGELPSALSIFLQGNVAIAPAAFGDGLRCAGGSLKRLYSKNASGGNANAPIGGDLSVHARAAQLGDVIEPGDVRVYQVYYRDPSLVFCPAPLGNTWNVTNAMRIEWR